MTDPGPTRPFAPAELDAIEDALEQLHGDDEFRVTALTDGGDAIVRERLASYRAISRLSRDVLRSYEAPAHVLERVRALARESAVATASPAIEEAPSRPSLWQRMRGAWTVPLFATAVTAGVVALVVTPMRKDAADRSTDVVAANEPAAAERAASAPSSTPEAKLDAAPSQGGDQRLAMADSPAREAEKVEGARGSAALDSTIANEQSGRRNAEDAESRTKAATTTAPADDGIAAGPKDERKPAEPKLDEPAKVQPSAKPKSPAPSATKGAGGVPGAAPPPATSPTKNEERKEDGDPLARADALRRSGDCASAVKLYESVRKSGAKKQRARALVGLALCAEREGERERAADLLAKARADDAEIDAYYDSQR